MPLTLFEVYRIESTDYTPKISVVMAVYNKAPYLPESIESVLSQSLDDFELICVDAASTDDSFQILNKYAKENSRVKVYSTPYSRIPAVTKNYGINRTTSSYVFLLDADDYLHPDSLRRMYVRAKETDADAIVPDLQTVTEHGEKRPPLMSGLKGNRDILLTNRQAVTESLDWSIHGFALWRGDLIRKLRLAEFGTYSDEYSTRVLFFHCNKVGFSDGLYFHRISNKSLTGKLSLQLCDRPEAACRVASFLKEHSFNQRHVDSQYFSAFVDCCFILTQKSRLAAQDAAEAEQRLQRVYEQIEMRSVRRSACTLTPGRAAPWPPKGLFKKYFFALLTLFGWGFLKRVPLKYLFSG